MKFPEKFRFKNAKMGYASNENDPFGIFVIPSLRNENERSLNVVAVDGTETGWEHVSVSLSHYPLKCPSWEEMCIVKKLFWNDDECIVQFHPQKSEYINNHPGVLHLWKCVKTQFPMPPIACV